MRKSSTGRPGILYVLSDPGPKIQEDQFHDWYNNEHGPERMRLPGFQAGYRYRTTDGSSPPWLATYDLDDLALLERPGYTRLRENRSPREQSIVSNIAVLDRQVFKLVTSKGSFQAEPASIAVNVILTVPNDLVSDIKEWYMKEHIDQLARVPGWLRSRLFVSVQDNASGFTRTLGIHEYSESNGLGGPEHKAAMSTPWRARIYSAIQGGPNRRVFSLHRTFSKVSNDLEHLPSDALRVIDAIYSREDGVKLHYRLEGNSTGPVIVFSNSLLTDLHIWDKVVSQLVHKFKILRYDTRGHGRSSSTGEAFKIPDLSFDISSLLSALNIGKIYALIGVSLGGVTALHFALHNSASLSRLIAADCKLASNAPNNAAWEERIALASSTEPGAGIPELARQTISRWFLPTSLHPHRGDGIQAVENMILSTSLSGLTAGARALCDYDLQEHIPNLKVPVLFLAGEKDGVLPKAMAEFVSIVPESQFGIVDNAGHLPMVENTEGFLQKINSFL